MDQLPLRILDRQPSFQNTLQHRSLKCFSYRKYDHEKANTMEPRYLKHAITGLESEFCTIPYFQLVMMRKETTAE